MLVKCNIFDQNLLFLIHWDCWSLSFELLLVLSFFLILILLQFFWLSASSGSADQHCFLHIKSSWKKAGCLTCTLNFKKFDELEFYKNNYKRTWVALDISPRGTPYLQNHCSKIAVVGGAAIAQWNCLRQPSCRPGIESQAPHLCFFIYSICAIFVLWKERK